MEFISYNLLHIPGQLLMHNKRQLLALSSGPCLSFYLQGPYSSLSISLLGPCSFLSLSLQGPCFSLSISLGPCFSLEGPCLSLVLPTCSYECGCDKSYIIRLMYNIRTRCLGGGWESLNPLQEVQRMTWTNSCLKDFG